MDMIFFSTVMLSNLQISEEDWFAIRRGTDLRIALVDDPAVSLQELEARLPAGDEEMILVGMFDYLRVPAHLQIVKLGSGSAMRLSAVEAEFLFRQMQIDGVPGWLAQAIGLCLCRYVRSSTEMLPRGGLLEAFMLGFGVGMASREDRGMDRGMDA